jgi:hypothetical protein
MRIKKQLVLVHYVVYCFKISTGNQCLQYCIQISTHLSLCLTGQPYCKKGRSAKVKDGIINLILRNYLIDRYRGWGRGGEGKEELTLGIEMAMKGSRAQCEF